jgi:hypothetical protein
MTDIWIIENWEYFGIRRRELVVKTNYRIYYTGIEGRRRWIDNDKAFDSLETAMDHANMLRAQKIEWHRAEIQRLEALEIKVKESER